MEISDVTHNDCRTSTRIWVQSWPNSFQPYAQICEPALQPRWSDLTNLIRYASFNIRSYRRLNQLRACTFNLPTKDLGIVYTTQHAKNMHMWPMIQLQLYYCFWSFTRYQEGGWDSNRYSTTVLHSTKSDPAAPAASSITDRFSKCAALSLFLLTIIHQLCNFSDIHC